MQICPNRQCKADNDDAASTCAQCSKPLRGLLGRGTVLDNRYCIDDLRGCGGYGAVYRATDRRFGNTSVAVKENLAPSSNEQFLAEAQLLRSLHHSNLPRVSDYFIGPNGRQYLVMDFIDGPALDEEVLTRETFSESAALTLLRGVFDALAYLHAQTTPIVHRDIKPENIIVTPEGKAFLVDLGIAKVGGADAHTVPAAQGVTHGFSPIEQYLGTGTDHRSDIYSLGATLYFVLTKHIPPPAPKLADGSNTLKPLRQLNPAVSASAAAAIEKAMTMRQEKRFASVTEFGRALTSVQPPEKKTEIVRPPRSSTRRKRVVILVLVCVLAFGLLASVGGILLNYSRHNSPEWQRNEAQRLSTQGRLTAAAVAYRKAINLDSSVSSYHKELGDVLFRQQKWSEAESAYKKATELDSSIARNHNDLGNALYNQRKWSEAEAAYKKATELGGSNAVYHNDLGDALHNQQKWSEAEAAYKKATELDGSNAMYCVNWAMALHNQQKWPETEAAYEEAVKLDGSKAWYHSNWARALAQQKKWSAAETEFRRAIELDKSIASCHYELGNALYNQGKLSDAEAAYEEAVKLDGTKAEYYDYLGHALYGQKRYKEAEVAHREAVRLSPKTGLYHRNLAWDLYTDGRLLEARQEAETARSLGYTQDLPNIPAVPK